MPDMGKRIAAHSNTYDNKPKRNSVHFYEERYCGEDKDNQGTRGNDRPTVTAFVVLRRFVLACYLNADFGFNYVFRLLNLIVVSGFYGAVSALAVFIHNA